MDSDTILTDADAEGAYFKLTPISGSRPVDLVFGNTDVELQQRFVTKVNQPINPNDYSVGVVDFDTYGSTQPFMVPKVPVPNHFIMARINSFQAVNAGTTISDFPWMRNNKFWVLDNWSGSLEDYTFDQLRAQPWRLCTIPNGSYLAQDQLVKAMKLLQPDIEFEWLPDSRMKYTGQKPLMFPITPDFTFEYLATHDQFVINQTQLIVPGNVSGITQPVSPSNVTYTTEVNGVAPQLSYVTPLDWAYSLLTKLGFNAEYSTGASSLQRTYCTYNMKYNSPNTSNPSVIDYLEGEGEMFVIIYPGAEASCLGNMLGPMMRVSIICDEIERIGAYAAAFGRFPIASVPPYTTYDFSISTYQPNTWYRVRAGDMGVRKMTFRLVDDYGNPYILKLGAPTLQVLIAYRQSLSD